MATIIIPTNGVLKWLQDNHPAIEWEVDRNWVWIITNLKSDEGARKAVKEFGFRFKKGGEHTLPSGRTARWAHHCERPTRGSKPGKSARSEPRTIIRPEFRPAPESVSDLESQIRAELGL